MVSWTSGVTWVHGGPRATQTKGVAVLHRCSPTLAGEDEEDEAEPEASSPKQERQRRGGVTTAEYDGGRLMSRGR
jgi:hypothetical protein